MILGQDISVGRKCVAGKSMSLQEQFEEAFKLASSGSNAGLKSIDTEKQKKIYGWFKQVFDRVVKMCVKF
jgi:hypothetical protein